jgi:hypothetical protein
MNIHLTNYTLSIDKEEHYGKLLYVGNIIELPTLEVFGDTFEEAYKRLMAEVDRIENLPSSSSIKEHN